MEIEVRKNHSVYLIFKADNILVEEDVDERTYPKLENGKTDFSNLC